MPRLPEFEYHPEAILEAGAAFEWYANRSQQAANGFLDELIRARKQVIRHPKIYGSYFHGTRCARLRRYPYGLVYVEREELIVGVAVAHFKRKPGYWRDRLAET